MNHPRLAELMAMTVLCVGCASAPLPPAPILSLADRVCTSAPELGKAAPLVLDKSKPSMTEIDHGSPCWSMADGSRSSYAVFLLPESAVQYLISVDSTPLGLSLFSPKLLLLDAAGQPLRTVTREQAQFRGNSLTLLTQIHSDERYAVVASEPLSIGQVGQRIQSSLSAVATSYGSIYTGAEESNTFTNSHNGRLTVGLRPLATDAIAKP